MSEPHSPLPHAVATCDERGCLTGWSTAAERLFGWGAPDMLGRSIDGLFPHADAQAAVPRACLARAGERGWVEETRWLRSRPGAICCRIAILALPPPQRGFAFAAQAVEPPAPGEPAATPAPAPVQAPAPPHIGRAPRLEGVRVLVVEDTVDAAEALKVLLEFENAIVVLAEDGGAGLAALDTQPFDVVISDIAMPGMDGYAFVEALRRRPALLRLPVIALTGFGRARDVDTALAAGFDAHVGKPVVLDQLVEQVRGLLQR